MNIYQFYKGKNILITGATGFIGKILVEKLLYSFPDISKIYIIIRPKKGKQPMQRFHEEVLEAKCFNRLKQIHQGHFKQFISIKIVAFAGDVEKQNLGLDQKDYHTIINNCQIVIANAANIKFDALLHQQMQANLQGTLRALQIAKKCNAQIFTYTSTFAVSSNLPSGYIEQKIYQLQGNKLKIYIDKDGKITDCQQLYQYINSLTPQQLKNKTQQLISKYNYKNVYMFTKGLCQRMVNLRRGITPVAIIRPTMVYSTYKQPFPGWIDVLHAGQITYLFIGLGLLQQFYIDPYLQVDTVPGDIVVNNLIVSSAYHAGKNQLTVHHVSSIQRNPILWKQMIYLTVQFWKAYPTPKRFATPHAIISNNQLKIKLHFYKRQLLLWFYIKFVPICQPQKKKQIQKLDRLNKKIIKITDQYRFDFQSFWVYQNVGVEYLKQWLGTDNKQFLIDCADINMLYYFLMNNYGIKKYILKEPVDQIPKIILQNDRIQLSVTKEKERPKL